VRTWQRLAIQPKHLSIVPVHCTCLLYLLVQEKRKDAVKKVIAAMTVGKDVSMLFTDVVNCMQTENLELKKLVYLYLINYAKSQPDLAILAVNTFVKVCMRAVNQLLST